MKMSEVKFKREVS